MTTKDIQRYLQFWNVDLRSSLEFLQVKDKKEDPELCP